MQLYWETPDKRIHLCLGNAQNLSALADESIDMIATSPPYWGKRNYGEELVAIWGGKEDGCEHEWGMLGTIHAGGIQKDEHGGQRVGRDFSAQNAVRDRTAGQFCLRCNAWYGQLGLEPTWQLYIAHLCECAKEWWRVLKPTGNLFVNIGDSFFGMSRTRKESPGVGAKQELSAPKAAVKWQTGGGSNFSYTSPSGDVPKHKLGVPFRLRFALNDMGWVSRDDIIWYKGKEYPDDRISKVAMPESVKRRFACSYEMVMRFVKTPKMNYYVSERTLESRDKPPKERIEGQDFEWREHAGCEGKGCDSPRCKDGLIKYSFWHGVDQWFDLDAVRKPHLPVSLARYKRGVNLVKRTGAAMTPANKFWDKEDLERHGGAGTLRGRSYKQAQNPSGQLQRSPAVVADEGGHPAGANPGDVWIIQPEPFKLEHYAVWPSELCEMMIKVGCPKEVCAKRGGPGERARRVTGRRRILRYPSDDRVRESKMLVEPSWNEYETIGWSDCGCNEGFVPGVVLDPFGGGSGRLAKEARKLGRQAIIVDLKEEYLEMSKDCLVYGEKELFKEKKRREKTGMSQAVLW